MQAQAPFLATLLLYFEINTLLLYLCFVSSDHRTLFTDYFCAVYLVSISASAIVWSLFMAHYIFTRGE